MNPIRNTSLALTLALTLAACTSKVTPENYEKLAAGMSKDQVHAILGKPDTVTSDDIGNVLSLTKETWKGGKQNITVTYGNNALALKSLDKPEDKPQ